ncbi:MAG: HD-GYP domain-containing protein [Candidatus Omnitrophica bacterium]|nr:HD-GYP domain-containing protein [Candidatus Omnitrophota bacterium]
MVRISDILRRMGDEEEPSKKGAPAPPPLPARESPVELRGEIIPTTKLGMEESLTVYEGLLDFVVHEIFEKLKEGEVQIDGKKIRAAVERVVDRIQKGDSGLLYFSTTRSTPDYYLYAHAVNVCILSLHVGNGLGYPPETLVNLGVGALLCDLGMTKVMDIAEKEEKLTPEEYQKIQEHPRYTVDFLKKIGDLAEVSITIAQMSHERFNGKGYPLGLSGEEISEEAKIVSLCDVFEALTHPRSYRARLLPFEALKEVLKGKELFDPRVLKVFIQQITIYPVGTWVELSTGKEGEVVMTSPDFPLRPTIKVLFDSQKRKLAVPETLNLALHSTLYVKRVLQEEDIRLKETKKDVS